MKYGIIRAACASPSLSVADCRYNAEQIVKTVEEAHNAHVQVLVFPELSLTGYTCGDLFLQQTLQQSALEALLETAKKTEHLNVLFAVGLPFRLYDALYNCAAWLHKGKIVAIVPKMNIPNYSEFYERRYFTPATSKLNELIKINNDYDDIPFGTTQLIEHNDDPSIKIATEICEDLWVPLSPSTQHALCGATIIANLSASNEVVGKAAYRRNLVSAQSAKNICAYLYADAGHDESTSDMVFGGHNIIAANGTVLAESGLFSPESRLTVTDIDLELLTQERLRTTSFKACAEEMLSTAGSDYHVEHIDLGDNVFASEPEKSSIGFSNGSSAHSSGADAKLILPLAQHPFVPSDTSARSTRCRQVVEMQAEGLARRLRHTHIKSAVIGLSGGLDSTLALLVTALAFDKCSLPRSGISAITMPCFGTTNRTYTNACSLAKSLGATLSEIDIKKAVMQHFADIGQNPEKHDVTYENSQARERTQILMDWANKTNGLVIGTGDLSELALGWCTYNGDHMSMYGVNASIPKTLVRYLVSYFADKAVADGEKSLGAVLKDILDTPVSPELLPPTHGSQGDTISQKTEELVGPYELHDFFLYYMLRRGYTPKKIYFLACQAHAETYGKDVILKWLKVFYRRFFTQQFKRNCMPDGAKVGTVSLSPRGDWRMPSDASASLWLDELDSIREND